MNKKQKNILNFSIGTGLAVVLLWFFFKDADWSAVGAAIAKVDISLLCLAMFFQLSSLVVKSWRWQVFMNPIKRGISVHTCWKYFNIGFATTTLLPGRVGEIIRPYLLSREESIPFTSTFATIVTERMFDLIMVLVLFSSIFVFPEVAGPNPDDPNIALLKTAGLVVLIVSLVGFAFLLLLRFRLVWAKTIISFFSKPFPEKMRNKLLELVETFATGVGSLSSWFNIAVILVLTFVAWILGSMFFWLAIKAFGFDLPFYYFFFMQSATALGVTIPTPAGSGGYHGAFLLVAVSLWGLPDASMQAAALITHLLIFGSMTLIGTGYLITGRINVFSAADQATEKAVKAG